MRSITDKNVFARAYGFTVSTKIYFDSLTKADLEIFRDTSALPLYTQHGIVDAGITLGTFCKMAYMSTIEERKTAAKEPVVAAAVKDFIVANSKFSSSYHPIKFSSYTWGGTEGQIFYQILHKYKIMQNDGKIVEAMAYFVLDENFKITLIETKRSNAISANPPRIDEWLKLYGKTNYPY